MVAWTKVANQVMADDIKGADTAPKSLDRDRYPFVLGVDPVLSTDRY